MPPARSLPFFAGVAVPAPLTQLLPNVPPALLAPISRELHACLASYNGLFNTLLQYEALRLRMFGDWLRTHPAPTIRFQSDLPVEQCHQIVTQMIENPDLCKTVAETFPVGASERADLINTVLRSGRLVDLAMAPIGNLLVQKLIDNAGSSLSAILDECSAHLLRLSANRFGCHIIIKLLAQVPSSEVQQAVTGFRGGETHMATDPNASHVLLFLIHTQDAEVLKPFVTSIACNEVCLKLARDRIGGRVLQELVNRLVSFVFKGNREHDKNAHAFELLRKLVAAIVANAPQLVNDEFANYVVQCLLAVDELPGPRLQIVKKTILGHVLELSQEKHASHVVERAVRHASKDCFNSICRELFEGYEVDGHGRSAVDILLNHQFGNYVIQTLLRVSIDVVKGQRAGDPKWFYLLRKEIIANETRLVKYTSGRTILQVLKSAQGCEEGDMGVPFKPFYDLPFAMDD
ncbi:pumilio-family RNA binding repeat containing protein [Aphelenchoides avenae]|nr:pumilio-family RNA binding repeat containing protein [Aphelenchus avenae]